MQVLAISGAAVAANNGTKTLVPDTDWELLGHNASRAGIIISVDVADVWVSLGGGAAVVQHGFAIRADGLPCVIHGWPGKVHVISAGAAVVGFSELLAAVGEDEGEEPTGYAAYVPSGPSDSYSADATESAENDPAQPGVPWPPQT